MLNAGGETYETLKQYAETVDLDGLPIRTINLEGLLRTKQTMRDKDVQTASFSNGRWRHSGNGPRNQSRIGGSSRNATSIIR